MGLNSNKKTKDYVLTFVKQFAILTRTRIRRPSFNRFRWNKGYILGLLDSHLIHYPTSTGLISAYYIADINSVLGENQKNHVDRTDY